MALEGSLKDFGLADILQLIYFQRKTGVLSLEGKRDKVRLLFIDGNIVGAESRRRIEANRLGKVLIKKGLLEKKDFQAILDEHGKTNVKIGNILIKKGLVEKEVIEEVLTGQIKETVVQIFGWKQGTYKFMPQEIPMDKELPISIDTQHLLMEGLRIVDEWSLIEGKLTLDTVFKRKDGDIKELSEEEREILSLVDGESDVSTIIDITARDDYQVSMTLISLMEKGVIEKKEIAPVVKEIVSLEIKKPIFARGYFISVIFVISVIISLITVFLNSDNIFKEFSASKEINDLRFQIEAYRFDHGSYPDDIGIIKSGYLDPWGRPFIYKKNDYTFIVLSKGADGIEGTNDDIY